MHVIFKEKNIIFVIGVFETGVQHLHLEFLAIHPSTTVTVYIDSDLQAFLRLTIVNDHY